MATGIKKVEEAIKEALKRMYKVADPPVDIDKLIETGEGKMPDFFMAYYLSMSEQEKIIEEVAAEFKLKPVYKRCLTASVMLGASPNSCQATAKKARKTYTRRVRAFLRKNKQVCVRGKDGKAT